MRKLLYLILLVSSSLVYSQEPDYLEIFGIPDDVLAKIMGVYIKPEFLESPYFCNYDFNWGQSAFLPYNCYAIYPSRIEDKYVLSFDGLGPVIRVENINLRGDIYELSVVIPFWEFYGTVYFQFLEDNMVHIWDGEFIGTSGMIGDQILFKLSGPGQPDNRNTDNFL